MSTTTATPARFTVERIDGDWNVVRVTSQGRDVVDAYASRQDARESARYLNESAEAEAAEVESATTEPVPDPLTGAALPTAAPTPEQAAAEQAALDVPVAEVPEVEQDDEVLVPSPEEEAARDEADRQAAELAAEHAAVDNDNAAQAAADAEHIAAQEAKPAARTKAAKHARTSLAKVKVGDRLMTNLTTEGDGIVYAAPYRFSDGQVRTVAEVTTRKAGEGEMPGKLYTLVFEDGTCTEERYGTTSHYLAEVFDGGPVTPHEPAPVPEPTRAPAKPKKVAPSKVATTASRAGKLTKGSRLVLRDLGVVTVDQVSKTGGGKLEVAYTTADDEAGVREMWGSTNVRVAADA